MKETPSVDANRRRLTKAGLAAPAVMGILASRQVLGAAPYQCTVSGQISGNLSVPGLDCSTLGLGFTGYSSTGSGWPACSNFFSGQCNTNNPRDFGQTPYSLSTRFADVFTMPQNQNQTRSATVVEVYNSATNLASTNGNITAEFGREALLALLNAFNNPNTFPLQPIEVVSMFNAIATTGSYNTGVINNTTWNGAMVLWYWKSLHG